MSSNKVTLAGEQLLVEPSKLNKVLSFKGKMSFSLRSVRGATLDDGILDERKGLKAPGAAFPGLWVGTFTKDGEKTFYSIVRPEEAVVIQLSGEKFSRLVLGVENPRELVDRINQAVQ